MKKPTKMFSFSSKLWYEPRRVNAETGITSLYLQVVIDGKHKEFPLKIRWPIKFVDMVNGVLLPRYKKDPEVADFNLIIQAERAKHTEINRLYRIKQEYLDLAKIKNELRIFNMRECFASYLDAERQRRFARREISRRTCQNGHVVLMRILEFDKLCLFKDIDAKWMKRFKIFLLSKKYLPGTVWGVIKVVKTYLKLASLESMFYVDESAVKFPNTSPKNETVFLTKDELTGLMNLTSNATLSATEVTVLRAFLFMSFTGLRISDLYEVNVTWQKQEGFLDFIPYKGREKGERIRIPLSELAQKFIQNLDGMFFTLPTMPEFNRTLKDLAKMANIKKKLTAHVARHTFGYLFMTTVGNLKALQELLGHRTALTTQRYAHLDDEYKQSSVKQMQLGFSMINVG